MRRARFPSPSPAWQRERVSTCAPALVLGLALLACRTSPPAVGLPAADQAAPGCLRSLAGIWRDEEDSSYAYRVEDAGGRVVAHPFVAGLDGAPAGSPEVVIELARSPEGLAGVVRQTGRFTFPDGTARTCTVEFVARVLSCSERRLEIEAEQSGALGPDCRRAGDEAPDLARHVWIRE